MWPKDGALTSTTTPYKSEDGSNGNKMQNHANVIEHFDWREVAENFRASIFGRDISYFPFHSELYKSLQPGQCFILEKCNKVAIYRNSQ